MSHCLFLRSFIEVNMKKILIIIPYFGVGGTTSSLKAFLDNVDTSQLKVDIFARKRHGVYLGAYENCTILSENFFLSSQLYSGNVIKRTMCRSLHLFQCGLSRIGLSILPIVCKIGGNQMHTQEYDAVISYQESMSGFLSYIPAKKRIAWIRSEYERYLKVGGGKDESKFFKKIDTVVAVSDFAKLSFLKVHPWHPNVITINNYMNIEDVRERSKDKSQIDTQFEKGDFTIVSVGRISPVKQFEKIPSILHDVRKRTGKDVRWYIIGGARGFNELEQQINADVEKFELKDSFKILPETSNPFAYMAEADLFVHTSESETYSRVVAEAKSVGTPVVVNNFAAAYEFVKDGEEGLIVPIEEMPENISTLIADPKKMLYFMNNLLNYTWDNKKIMERTIKLL